MISKFSPCLCAGAVAASLALAVAGAASDTAAATAVGRQGLGPLIGQHRHRAITKLHGRGSLLHANHLDITALIGTGRAERANAEALETRVRAHRAGLSTIVTRLREHWLSTRTVTPPARLRLRQIPSGKRPAAAPTLPIQHSAPPPTRKERNIAATNSAPRPARRPSSTPGALTRVRARNAGWPTEEPHHLALEDPRISTADARAAGIRTPRGRLQAAGRTPPRRARTSPQRTRDRRHVRRIRIPHPDVRPRGSSSQLIRIHQQSGSRIPSALPPLKPTTERT
jgi:hypothetical protein